MRNPQHDDHIASLTAEVEEARAKIALWRDCFAEITAKATPYGSPPDDPERISAYLIPAGPLHRAAGKTGFQAFDGESHLASLTARLEAAERERDEAQRGRVEALREIVAMRDILNKGKQP